MPENEEHHAHVDRRMVTFIGVMAAMFLSALDQTIVSTAMPTIVKELNGLAYLSWVTTAYLMISTAVVPVVGKLSEQLGRKRVFLSGIALFLLGSALCGLSQNMFQLIAFRGFQGIGAGILTGTAFAIIADLFSPAERGKYTGLFVSVFGLASIVGPLAGGTLTDHVGWRWVFYVNLPIGALVLIGLALSFPPSARPHTRQKIDFLGAAGIGFGALMMVLGASLAGINDWGYPPVWIGIIGGAALIAVTMFHEARTPEAVVPPHLFQSSIFSLSMIVVFLQGILMFATLIFIPLFLQAVVGVTATNSGLLLLPLMGGMVVSSIIGGFAISATGRYKVQAVLGFFFMAAGMYLLTLLTVTATQADVARAMVIIGLGLGTSMPVFNIVAQNAVDQRFMSSATSAMQFIRQIGGTMGIAVLGALFTQAFTRSVTANIPPATYAGLPKAVSAGIRANLGNPQQLLQFMGDHRALVQTPQGFLALRNVVGGVKLALTQSSVEMFSIGLLTCLVALLFATMIHEIPLRKTRGVPAPARPADGPAPEPMEPVLAL